MSDKDFATEILELLNALEQRVHADPALAAEYKHQQAGFPAPVGDQHSALRFREWFLLEHSPSTLGAPPILAWSPEGAEDGSTWEALLGARFGILRPLEGAEESVFEELWTGRRIELVAAPGAGETELLMVGWFAPLGDEVNLPLPGARALVVPGLEQALVRDLAQARADNPRGRLSHLACEQMMLAIANANAPEGYPKDIVATVDLEAELAALLLHVEAWSVDRALDVLAIDGDAVLLEQLAFDTDVDLEALRRLMLEYRESLGDETEPKVATAPAAENLGLASESVAAALEAFDSSAGNKPVGDRFSELEAALGLEAGSTEEGAPLEDDDAEALGPGDLPGLPFWIASWAWEMGQVDTAPTESELKVLATWTDFLNASRDGKLDAPEIMRSDLTAFLMASPDDAELERRVNGLARFLRWLETEQQAGVDGLAEGLENELGACLKAAVSSNAELASNAVRADATAVLTRTDPPTVEAEDGQAVEVEGLPEAARAHCQPGDRVLGHWTAGQFRVAAWMPQELLPSTPQTS